MTFMRQISIRLTKELSDALDERADKNKRSLNNEIVTILENIVLSKNSNKKKIADELRTLANEVELIDK